MTKEQAIITAVEWWANKLKAKAPHSNGDSSLSSIFACFLADGGMEDVTEEKLDIFKRELRAQIEADINNCCGEVYLGCDYNPTTSLRESAKTAGISQFNFPYKTDLYIKKQSEGEYSVYVYDGYRSPREELSPIV